MHTLGELSYSAVMNSSAAPLGPTDNARLSRLQKEEHWVLILEWPIEQIDRFEAEVRL